MNKIIAIHSVGAEYFYVGKMESGYFLRNRYTVIPNEFKRCPEDYVKRVFDDLCERIPECVEVARIDPGQKRVSYMTVVYDDFSEKIFMEQIGVGKNLGAYISYASRYSEFYDETFMSIMPSILNTDRIRLVCSYKREDLDTLCDAVEDLDGDDYQHFFIEPREDGGYNIACKCYGVVTHEFITIDKDGRIGNTGRYTYIQFLKDQGVRVYRNEAFM